MTTVATSIPTDSALAEGLASALSLSPDEVRVVARERNAKASTFPSEFATFILANEQRLELFCKYVDDDIDDCFGHRSNAAFEARVYRELLPRTGLTTPRFVGAHSEAAHRRTWLFLERITLGRRIDDLADFASGMREAARWLGAFHGGQEARPHPSQETWLPRRDEDYYMGWIERTVRYADGQRHPWLPVLLQRSAALVEPLVTAPHVLIHGEFYPHNILIQGDSAFPHDWQSAAVAAAEIDLASLAERWPVEVVDACEAEYLKARWPTRGASSREFAARLRAARIHWHCRWLGDRPEWSRAERLSWRLDALRAALEGLGA